MPLSASKIQRAQSYNQRQGLPGSVEFVRAVESFQALYNAMVNPRVKLVVDGAYGRSSRSALTVAVARPATDPARNAAHGVQYAISQHQPARRPAPPPPRPAPPPPRSPRSPVPSPSGVVLPLQPSGAKKQGMSKMMIGGIVLAVVAAGAVLYMSMSDDSLTN